MNPLQLLKSRLQQIHDSISYFQPLTARPPILDSSFEPVNESNEEDQWLKQENIPGLKKLKENIALDLTALDKVLFHFSFITKEKLQNKPNNSFSVVP